MNTIATRSVCIATLACLLCLAGTSAADEQKPASIDPRAFVKRDWFEGMPYHEAREAFDHNALPTLHTLLDDADYAAHWPRVGQLIGYLEGESASASALLKYFRRADPEHWRMLDRKAGYRAVLGKIESLRWMGLVGGKDTSAVLREALTDLGAAKLGKEWIDNPALEKFGMDRARMLALIRGRAAMGIVYSQNANDMSLVEEMYRREDAHCRNNKVVTKLYSELVSAMGVRDLIKAKGLAAYLGLFGTGKDHQAVEPYLFDYAWHLSPTTQ